MDCKRDNLLRKLRQLLQNNPFWKEKLSESKASQFTLHLAVLREPYLQFILEGKKTVETRFAKRPCPPFERVRKGDVLLLKRTPGGVVGICVVESAWFYKLQPESIAFIKSRFGSAICADNTFWKERKDASVATLMLIERVTPLQSFRIDKRDRRGWVVLKDENPIPLLKI